MKPKPLSIEDFELTPAEMKALVEGAAKFFPPVPDNEKELVDEVPE